MKANEYKSHEMTATDAAIFCAKLDNLGIKYWVEGGWGVDALLKRQTRTHNDLDLIIQEKDAKSVRKYLDKNGYSVILRDDLSDIKFHYENDLGHEIDFTVIEFDSIGNGIFGPRENGEMNPAASFSGSGSIDGLKVGCVSPEFAIKFHLGYDMKQKDRDDVNVLCREFGIDVPKEYL